MALEIGASRLLAPTVGVSLYSWTGIIGVVLNKVEAAGSNSYYYSSGYYQYYQYDTPADGQRIGA